MIVGIGILSTMVLRSMFGSISENYHTPIDLSGLYWDFVDIIWFFCSRSSIYQGALEMSAPKVSARTYLFTWISLLGLTLLTSLLGTVNLGPMSLMVGLMIAATKASLIAVFFMHALYDSKLVRVVLAGGIVWLLMLITLTIADNIIRGWLPFSGK